MANDPMQQHGSKMARVLFEGDTPKVRSLWGLVDEHAGDAVFLANEDEQETDADIDDDEQDFMDEINEEEEDVYDTPVFDPDERSADDADDDSDEFGETDIVNADTGIARGFGSNVPIDSGDTGFQIEEIPRRALAGRAKADDGEELDDYDDDDPSNGKFDPRDLEELSIPSSARVRNQKEDTDK
jgi:hypothetical protein